VLVSFAKSLERLVASRFGVGWSLQSELATEEEATMSEDSTNLGRVIRIDDERVRDYCAGQR
jgi:hypothetical protein